MTSGSGTRRRVFRLPRSAYIAVLFLFIGTSPIAFTNGVFKISPDNGASGPTTVFGWQAILVLIPVLVAVFIWRWATFVDSKGITIRALFGKRKLAWEQIRGLSVGERSIYAVTSDGVWRLPCVHVADLGVLTRASAGRLPEVDYPTPKYAPQRRRR